MRRPRGFSLLETVLALGLSILVLLAVETLFVDSMRYHVLSDQVIRRTLETEVLDASVALDVAETDLRLATVITADDAASDGTPPPRDDRTDPQRTLSALAIPRARSLTDNEFTLDPKTCVPVWQSLRVTYLRGGDTVLKEMDLRPLDGKPVTRPIAGDVLRRLCESEGRAGGAWERIAVPKIISRSIERFHPVLTSQQATFTDNEPITQHALTLTLRRADARREGRPLSRTATTRVYESWNSTFDDPGPLKSPMPLQAPAWPLDAGRNEW